MGYRMIDLEQLYEIYRRHHAGQKKSRIIDLGFDRKTIDKYLKKLDEHGLNRANPLFIKDEFVITCKDIIQPRKPRTANAESQFELYCEEIESLVFDRKEPVKPKTAYRILCDKYMIDASYESFKRFFRKSFPGEPKTIIRIELEPGKEVQMDYGKVGHLIDGAGKNRTVYAFVAILSCSRHIFIEFVYSQSQQSFCESFTRMFEFYGGVPEFISIDNLKSGVIKPDIYEPQINRAFQELAEHYETFIDPCRVGTPTDKGKVERMVPLAREEFRRLKAVHPDYGMLELNQAILKWCKEEYGNRVHGTTGEKPFVVFENVERSHLKSLPASRFDIPVWKEVKVHPDQFIQFEKKRYSLPSCHRGETLWARKKGHILDIFKDSELIRSYPITGNNTTYAESDFPEAIRGIMHGDFSSFILKQAERYGEAARSLIESSLGPRAYLNTRCAQGMLRIFEDYHGIKNFNHLCRTAELRMIKTPNRLKHLFEEDSNQSQLNYEIPRSSAGEAMLRDANYFFKEDS